MKAFEPLEPDDETYSYFEELLHSEDSSRLGMKPPGDKQVDSYSLAVSLSRSLDNLKDLKKPLSKENANTLSSLIHNLQDELKMLRKDPREFQLRLERLQREGPLPKPGIAQRKARGLQLDSARLEGEFQSRGDKNYLKSFLHLAYRGFQDLEAHFEINARNRFSNAPTQETGTAEAYFPRWNLSLENKAGLDEIKIGRFSSELGMGLGINSSFEGIEARKQYKEYEMRLGYHNGFFGAVSTPIFFDLPITLYTLQEKGSNRDQTQLSGISLLQNLGNFTLGSEFVESDYSGSQHNADQSAFSIHLGYQPKTNWKISSSLTHTGDGFTAARGWDPGSDWYFGVSDAIQEKVSRSLTRFFGKRITHLPGYSDLQMSLLYDLSANRSLQFSWDWAYDHTTYNIHHNDQFQVAAIEMDWGIHKDSTVSLRIEKLFWNQPGQLYQGLLGSFHKEDAFSVESGISMRF